jgi:hypothetical protein
MDIKIGSKFQCASPSGDPVAGVYSVVGFAVDSAHRVYVKISHDLTGTVIGIMPDPRHGGWWMHRLNPRKYGFVQLGYRTI